MKNNKNWYKEPSYRMMIIALLTLMVVFTIGAWIVDGEVGEMGAIYLFGGGTIVSTIMAYIMRNNP